MQHWASALSVPLTENLRTETVRPPDSLPALCFIWSITKSNCMQHTPQHLHLLPNIQCLRCEEFFVQHLSTDSPIGTMGVTGGGWKHQDKSELSLRSQWSSLAACSVGEHKVRTCDRPACLRVMLLCTSSISSSKFPWVKDIRSRVPLSESPVSSMNKPLPLYKCPQTIQYLHGVKKAQAMFLVNWPMSSSPTKILITSLTYKKDSNSSHLNNSSRDIPKSLCGSPQVIIFCISIYKVLSLQYHSKEPFPSMLKQYYLQILKINMKWLCLWLC